MNIISKISLKAKIVTLILISMISLTVLGTVSIKSSMNLNESGISLYKNSYIPLSQLAEINELMRTNLQEVLLASYHDPKIEVSKEHEKTHSNSAHLDKITKNTKRITELWNSFIDTNLTSEEREISKEYKSLRSKFVEEGLLIAVKLIKEGKYNEAQLHTAKKIVPYFNESKGKAEELLKLQKELTISKIKDAENIYSTTKTTLIFIIIISLMLLFLTGTLIIKNIVSSVNAVQSGLISFFSFLNHETTKAEIININSQDEFGGMAKSINENIRKVEAEIIADNKFIDDVQHVMSRVENGWFSQHIEAHTNNSNLESLKSTINQGLTNLRENFVLINNVLEEYCNYDYTKEAKITNIEADGVFDTLVKDINKLRSAITEMLSDSLQNGVDLQDDASSLKQSVEILSTASNQQAASLEETAAAMEEMTSNVQNNAQKSTDMATMAQETDAAAKEGAELANRTSVAMTEIQEATNSINDAVVIIENIAFQTNILSLNAAVEAATAGDAGKGFAVVAQEVRNLANRSADAAKEIKSMAAQAAQKSNEGMNISQELTHGFEVIASKIQQTTVLVQDVSNASKEQMQGIGQINTAVTQLDQMTQENAKVAAQADSIADATIHKAQVMVDDASSKEFVGKGDINTSQTKKSVITQKKPMSSVKPVAVEKPRAIKKNISTPAKALKNDDVWENF
jgi:methyl-accepting chemotaxis protein